MFLRAAQLFIRSDCGTIYVPFELRISRTAVVIPHHPMQVVIISKYLIGCTINVTLLSFFLVVDLFPTPYLHSAITTTSSNIESVPRYVLCIIKFYKGRECLGVNSKADGLKTLSNILSHRAINSDSNPTVKDGC